MNKPTMILTSLLFVIGTTVGAGIFALPFTIQQSGWVFSSLWACLIVALIVFCHNLYARVLEENNSHERLLVLLKKYYGLALAQLGFIAIIIGLLLTLVIYLILAPQFARLLIPNFPEAIATLLFWIIVSTPLAFRLRRLVGIEIAATVLMVATIVLLVSQAGPIGGVMTKIPLIAETKNVTIPFAPFIFALAGWTAVEPIVELAKRLSHKQIIVRRILAVGTIASALLYLLFVVAIVSSSAVITTDTISGLAQWGWWQKAVLMIVGLIAIATSYLPIGLEIENSLQKDLKKPRSVSVLLVIFFPLFLVFSGLKDFMIIINLVGAVFLGIQYICILLVAKKALHLKIWEKGVANIIIATCTAFALYQVYLFAIG